MRIPSTPVLILIFNNASLDEIAFHNLIVEKLKNCFVSDVNYY